MPGKFPGEYKLHSEQGESLKTTIACLVSKLMEFCTRVYLLNIWHGGFEFLKGAQ
jgi:hypothetical protein